MKLLMLFTHDYWLKPHHKNLPEVPDVDEPLQIDDAVVALIHVEPMDLEQRGKRITKAIKNIKWLARKFETTHIVLHSFAHLARENAAPEEAHSILAEMQDRLTQSGYQVLTSPFGYFNEFKLHVAGPSLAKVFVEI